MVSVRNWNALDLWKNLQTCHSLIFHQIVPSISINSIKFSIKISIKKWFWGFEELKRNPGWDLPHQVFPSADGEIFYFRDAENSQFQLRNYEFRDFGMQILKPSGWHHPRFFSWFFEVEFSWFHHPGSGNDKFWYPVSAFPWYWCPDIDTVRMRSSAIFPWFFKYIFRDFIIRDLVMKKFWYPVSAFPWYWYPDIEIVRMRSSAIFSWFLKYNFRDLIIRDLVLTNSGPNLVSLTFSKKRWSRWDRVEYSWFHHSQMSRW